MKRVCAILLALLLILSGCAGKVETKDISVKDTCCPYEISHKKDVVELILQDGEKQGICWDMEAMPADICEVTKEDSQQDYTTRYRIAGLQAGATQLTFTAKRADETVAFVLTLLVDVDAETKAVVSSCQHQQMQSATVEADGLRYQWNVDAGGVLHFAFTNDEDTWSIFGDGEGVCTLSNVMSTPAGCKFSARAKTAGQTTVVLKGETTQRIVHVVLQADDHGKLEIVSVQEQKNG